MLQPSGSHIFKYSQAKSATETIQSLRERVSYGEKDLLEKLRMAREEEWANRTQLEIEKSDVSHAMVSTMLRLNSRISPHQSSRSSFRI